MICSRSFVTTKSRREVCCWCLNSVGWSIICVSRLLVSDLVETQGDYFQEESYTLTPLNIRHTKISKQKDC